MTRDRALTGPETEGHRAKRESWSARHPAWPITALLVGWPAWWILGVGDYAPVMLAVPIAWIMYRWRATGTRAIRLPPGFGLWLLFLLVTVAGVTVLGLTAPDTITSSVTNRLISWFMRTASYFAAFAFLLYAGNLTEKELPRRRLAWLLGLVGLYTVAGGVGGVVLPTVQFTSPLAHLVPQRIQQNNTQVQMMLHPATAQVMNFLGYAEGRPSAPFSYTNMWGYSLAILLPWVVVGWYLYGSRRSRRIGLAALFIAFIPVVYSLDRGLWVGIGICVCYLAIRFAARGKMMMLGLIAGAIAIAAVLILVTPLGNLIGQRLDHGRSNTGRTADSMLALRIGLSSPFIGYGDTRRVAGSAASITLGRSANCQACGQSEVGGDGQLQLLLVCSGLLGAALYISFFGYGIWRYRRDRTPYGIAGVLVLLVPFWFMFVYEAVGPPLAFTMLSYALLWRNDRERQRQESALIETDSPVLAAGAARHSIMAGGFQ